MVLLSTDSPWRVCFKPNPQARLRLFCFPYAGGAASIYRLWPQLLPETIEVHAIQLPGREGRLLEPTYVRLAPIIDEVTQAIAPLLDRPFALFGHSLGALLAFELARQLRRLQRPQPIHFFASARRAPQFADPDPPIHRLPDAEFLEEVR